MTKAQTQRRKRGRKAARRPQRDPRGGLTAAGRAAFRKRDGSHLRPGVKGPADTPAKMRRKGSFLRRHFATLRGPLKDADGNPTRLALQAHAWGEPVPKTAAAARKLAAKGAALLERYAAVQNQPGHRAKRAAPLTAAAKKKRRKKAGARSNGRGKKKTARKKTATSKGKKKAVARKKTAAPRKKVKARRKKSSGSKTGLYANIHKAQARAAHGGRPVRKKGQKGAPTDKAFAKAKKTAKA